LIPDEVTGFFYLPNFFSRPGFDSGSNRNEYQESSCGVKGDLLTRKAENLTAICKPIV
jgi:hypothetical protein